MQGRKVTGQTLAACPPSKGLGLDFSHFGLPGCSLHSLWNWLHLWPSALSARYSIFLTFPASWGLHALLAFFSSRMHCSFRATFSGVIGLYLKYCWKASWFHNVYVQHTWKTSITRIKARPVIGEIVACHLSSIAALALKSLDGRTQEKHFS